MPQRGKEDLLLRADHRTKRRSKEEMSQLGKRYRCEQCGTEVLCTKPGKDNPVCCDKEMGVQEPKALPSSD